MALLPPPYPTALGLIGPSKKPVLMTSARSDQGHRLRAIAIQTFPLSLPQGFQLLFFSFRLLVIQYLDNRENLDQ
jgi:hypothetical protein